MAVKKAISFRGFAPVPNSYEMGALLPGKPSADALCKGINDLSPGWIVEERKLDEKSYWRVVWLGPDEKA